MELIYRNQLSTLSHPQRMEVFRLLVRHYPSEVRAGEISKALGNKANTTSVYLSALKEAQLVVQRRNGKTIMYRANLDAAGALIQYMLTDCCRDRLDVLVADQRPLVLQAPVRVLFLCTGNSARSLMAEAILRDLAGDRFNVSSAGTKPADTPHPSAMEVLAKHGHETSLLSPKSMTSDKEFDFVITLCDLAANEDCAVWPGHPMSAHWGLPDPAQVDGSTEHQLQAFEATYQKLKSMAENLANLHLQIASRADLQTQIDQIGMIHLEG